MDTAKNNSQNPITNDKSCRKDHRVQLQNRSKNVVYCIKIKLNLVRNGIFVTIQDCQQVQIFKRKLAISHIEIYN